MKVSNFKERYTALQPLPKFPGEHCWVDRLRTWRDFVKWGEQTANLLERLYKDRVKALGKEEGARDYHERFRKLCPELHDLLMEYFEKRLPWTTEGKNESPR